MKSLRILITAGPTRENIDPVRFISNRSSGKMGYALAEAAQKLKLKVSLITGPVSIPSPENISVSCVESAEEMFQAVKKQFAKNDIIIMAAAVADYRPALASTSKIKKTKDTLTLKLIKTPDILKHLGSQKKPRQLLVGFAAETNELLRNAKKKLLSKNLDLIVANEVGKKGSGFESDENKVTVIESSGKIHRWPKMSKKRLGVRLLNFIKKCYLEKNRGSKI